MEIFPVSACGEEQDATGDFVRTKIAWRRKDLGENQRSHGLSSAGEDKVVEEKNFRVFFGPSLLYVSQTGDLSVR